MKTNHTSSNPVIRMWKDTLITVELMHWGWKRSLGPILIKIIPFRSRGVLAPTVLFPVCEMTALPDHHSLRQSIGHLSCFSTSQNSQAPENSQAGSSLGLGELVEIYCILGSAGSTRKRWVGCVWGWLLVLTITAFYVLHPSTVKRTREWMWCW